MHEDVPASMAAVLLNGHGGFDQLIHTTEAPTPRPSTGEVLIRIGAAGVNNTDINTRIGWYDKSVGEGTASASAAPAAAATGWTGRAHDFPRIQGADACGRIVAVGPGVDAARIGERVLVEPVFRAAGAGLSEAVYFGSECDGAFAEYARVPARHAHRVRSSLSDVELAALPCAYSAAENMLTRAALRAGERVLVTGASGGVGLAAVQLARRRGAEVIASCSASKQDFVQRQGASRTLAPDEALESHSLDVVVDVVGGGRFPQLLEALRPGGRYAVAGAIAGPKVDLDLRILYLKDLRLLGCTVLEAEVFPNLVGYVERGEIAPVVARTFPLAEIVEAQKEFLTKRQLGKIVLTVSG